MALREAKSQLMDMDRWMQEVQGEAAKQWSVKTSTVLPRERWGVAGHGRLG